MITNADFNAYILNYIKNDKTKVQSCFLEVGEQGKAIILLIL